jgi:hypothetical protein
MKGAGTWSNFNGLGLDGIGGIGWDDELIFAILDGELGRWGSGGRIDRLPIY